MKRNGVKWSIFRQCCESGFRRAKKTYKNRKKICKFNFLNCWMFSFLVFKILDPDPDRWIRIHNHGSWRSVSYKIFVCEATWLLTGNENSSKIIARHRVANPDSYRSALFLKPGSGSTLEWKSGSVSAKWKEGCRSGSALIDADTQPWLEMNHETTIKCNTL